MRELKIAYGSSCFAKVWSNKTITFDALCERLKNTIRTPETVEEYPKLSKAERDRAKDKGGMVGGWLKQGRRKAANVECRSMLTHDIDSADPDFLERYRMLNQYASCLYSTHSHTPEKMRLRLIIPLSRTVTPDEYAAISRRIADELTLTRFDPTTFEPARLMYWPSTPEDGEFFFHCEDAPFLDPDVVLKTYADWRDASLWPTTQPVEERIRHTAGKQEDPTEKRGIIGAFCRAHTVTDVLTHILSDRYTPTEQDDRYTFIGGSTTGGLVVYDDKYAFSHHATDPAGGKLCNAFDLVRWHLFTPGGTAPDGSSVGDEKNSIRRMQEYAAQDEATKRQLAEEGVRVQRADGGEPTEQRRKPRLPRQLFQPTPHPLIIWAVLPVEQIQRAHRVLDKLVERQPRGDGVLASRHAEIVHLTRVRHAHKACRQLLAADILRVEGEELFARADKLRVRYMEQHAVRRRCKVRFRYREPFARRFRRGACAEKLPIKIPGAYDAAPTRGLFAAVRIAHAHVLLRQGGVQLRERAAYLVKETV